MWTCRYHSFLKFSPNNASVCPAYIAIQALSSSFHVLIGFHSCDLTPLSRVLTHPRLPSTILIELFLVTPLACSVLVRAMNYEAADSTPNWPSLETKDAVDASFMTDSTTQVLKQFSNSSCLEEQTKSVGQVVSSSSKWC